MSEGGSSRFRKAVRSKLKLRLALAGLEGRGKTWTALAIAKALGGRTLVIDTEGRSSELYTDDFEFDVLREGLSHYGPDYIRGIIEDAEEEGYSTIIIDSLSHEWAGTGGALELVDRVARGGAGNKFQAWGTVTPQHNALVTKILRSRCHIIATMRMKAEHVQDKDEKGRTVIRKAGLGVVQRDGIEYEFGIIGQMQDDFSMLITKSRCKVYPKDTRIEPGLRSAMEFGEGLAKWLDEGADPDSVLMGDIAAAATPDALRALAPAAKAGSEDVKAAYRARKAELEGTGGA